MPHAQRPSPSTLKARHSNALLPEGGISTHEREEALVLPAQAKPNQTKSRITPSKFRIACKALSRKALTARTRVTARHYAEAPARLASRTIHQPIPPLQASLPSFR